MKEVFKVDFKSHVQSASSILFLLLAGIVFTYVMSVKTGDDINVFIWISVVMFIFLGGPSIIIHFNYYIVNKGYVFEYAHYEKEITITHNGQYDSFYIDDIKHVDRFMCYNLAANRSSFVSWDGYNHSVIYLNNGKKFTITSLLVPNLNLPLEENRIIVKRGIYRLA